MDSECGDEFHHFATDAIHAGYKPSDSQSKAVIPSICLSTVFKLDEPQTGTEFVYSRTHNPSRKILEQALAAIEGAKHAFCFASGLGAATTMTYLLQSGDNIVCASNIYGGTFCLLSEMLPRFGVQTTFVDFTKMESLVAALKDKKPKMVWFEIVTNPTLHIIDARAVIKSTRDIVPEAIIIVDNTFLTPYYSKPLDLGADLVLHSLTKYINGHSDVVMGSLALNDDSMAKKFRRFQNNLGIIPSPFDCYQVNRGLKTLHIRMKQHDKNALVVAEFLEKHPKIERVLYPGLESHPQHHLARTLMKGYGGVISFYVKGDYQHTRRFLKSLKVITLAFSLGSFESLAEFPATMTHSTMSQEERLKIDITDNLVRLSVGLESAEDIIADLDEALKTK
ncbi:cystathionine gamma-lyase-like [Gigantopelta aegis]|uniref:cystathionine gamma-lyase-like n=1 Tax=Gigantopelta aegis TaxID=1735272 RepID=UPI001B88B48A|nr:cystathionine gamma-lyase-like [Gigantopelta aegis]